MKTLHRTQLRPAVWRASALVALLVCAGAARGAIGAGVGNAGHVQGAPQQPASAGSGATRHEPIGPVATPPVDSARGFSHQIHRGVDCTSCHLSRQSHGALKIRTVDDCQACHHSVTQKTACTRCHDAHTLPAEGKRSVDVRTSVATMVSRRSLPFSHGFHTDVKCAECHGTPPKAEVERSCSSCHARHHTEASDCQRCHRPQDVRGHPAAAVHTGCAGGGCHTDVAVTRLSWTRNVCLGCHQDRVEHQKARDCAGCHQVPALHAKRQEVAR